MTDYYSCYHSTDDQLHFAHKVSEPKHIPFEMHNLCELIYLKSGDVTYTVNDKRYHLGKDWLIITRPMDGHSIFCAQGESYERWVVQFEEEELPYNMCNMLPSELDVLDCGADKTVRELLQKMDRYANNFDKKTAKEMLLCLIQELLCDAMLMADNAKENDAHRANPAVAQAIQYIKDNIERPVSVEEVAKHLHVSAGYLRRLFLRDLQVSPKQYILALKLAFACRDLCDGEKPTVVCPRYGFADYSSFYRNFTKHFGYNPSQAAANQYMLSTES